MHSLPRAGIRTSASGRAFELEAIESQWFVNEGLHVIDGGIHGNNLVAISCCHQLSRLGASSASVARQIN